MEILAKSTTETKKLAVRVAGELKPGDVLVLYGNLGSGKTTFVQGLVEALGFEAKVQSPTFIVVRHYLGGKNPSGIEKINHVDLYRIQDESELANLGIQDMLTNSESVTIVEWPELVEKYLPKTAKVIKFEVVDENTRKITV